MFEITNTCGRCNELVDFRIYKVADYTPRSPEEIKQIRDSAGSRQDFRNVGLGVHTTTEDAETHVSALCHCPRCNGPALITFECRRLAYQTISDIVKDGEGAIMGGQSVISVTEVLPAPKQPTSSPHWPEKLVRQFADAQRMLDQDMTPSIIIGTCRTVLDVATAELSGSGDTLYKKIENLTGSGIITQALCDWAHTIRLDGNSALHQAEGDKASAAEYVEFLKMFLNMTFALPEQIRLKRQTS